MCRFLGPAQTYSIRTPKEVVLEPVSPPPGDSDAHRHERLSGYKSASQTEKCAHDLRILLNADSASGPRAERQALDDCKNVMSAPTP